MELTARGETLAEMKIQRGIFQGNAPSQLLCIIAMIPLNYLVRKCTEGYKFTKLKKKRSTNICTWTTSSLFAKNEILWFKQWQHKPGYRKWNLTWKISDPNNKKWKKRSNGRNRTANPRKNQKGLRKGKLQIIIKACR